MSDPRMERLVRMVQKERAECIQPVWWYLSFADPEHGWKGGVIVLAHGFATALLEAQRLRINPHGEVTGHPIPNDKTPAPKFRNRLLTKAELEECWGEPMVRFRFGKDDEIIIGEESSDDTTRHS